ncbi:hypothetical protein ARMGADRAFT_1035016 [Armillaria gallica]|uniref:F-box domain-containing protein n=1 Tax=Armillaria gallica TaxID=47427 RepID=A0A2H3D062_ARMGA|nr:hypothetical protein ARMGADRAFT_1035016 [Armillaria gallica]
MWASFSLLEHHETMQHWTADLTRGLNSPRHLTKMAENALRCFANAIYLVLPLPGATKHRESLDIAFVAIMKHSNRWKDARILADESRMFSLSSIRDNLPSLNKLRLHYINSTERVSSGFEIAPQLRDITLEYKCFPRYLMLPIPHLTNISFVHSDIHDIQPKDLHSIFEGASGLDEIHGTTQKHSLITLPALERLEWKLYVHSQSSRASDIPEHDTSFPALRRLIARSNGLQTIVFAVLSYGGVGLPKFPQLKTFKMYGSVYWAIERAFGPAAIAMMELRWRQGDDLGGCKLSAVEFSCIYLSTVSAQRPVSMRKEGLSVTTRFVSSVLRLCETSWPTIDRTKFGVQASTFEIGIGFGLLDLLPW